jgi:hypothetical protein
MSLATDNRSILFHPDSAPGLPPAPKVEGMTYSDLRPMLDGDPNRQALAMLRISEIARGDGVLSRTQLEEATTMALDFVDAKSPGYSRVTLVRIQAVIALQSIGTQPELLSALPTPTRDRAFSLLANIPTDRHKIREEHGMLSSESPGDFVESDKFVRSVCESAAGLFSKSA